MPIEAKIKNSATAVGSVAIVLWGTLALITTGTGQIPPFQLVAMTFAIAFLLMLCKWLMRGERLDAHLAHPSPVWLLGIGGLFGYHFFYFTALKNAPPVEASLIAYLWPLLIVVFSAMLPGERLGIHHVLGALMGLSGCALLVSGRGRIGFDMAYATGYASALACALTWSGYSVLARRFGAVPTDTVGWFCGATAVGGLVCHLLFEDTVVPGSLWEWLAVAALGLGPVGIAFFAWDVGVKRGDIRLLGVMSYMTLLLSALLLVAFGRAEATPALGLACLLIAGGALVAARTWRATRVKSNCA